MKKLLSVVACASIIGIASSASAYTYEMGSDSTVDLHDKDKNGLALHYEIDENFAGYTFDLAPGESKQFIFATFWTPESYLDLDDKKYKDIEAIVDFDNPDLYGNVEGDSFGFRYRGGFFYNVVGYEIVWDDAVDIYFGSNDTGKFSLELTDAKFSNKTWWNNIHKCDVAHVDAIVTHHTDPIPEPATMLLFGTGIAGLAAVRRRKN